MLYYLLAMIQFGLRLKALYYSVSVFAQKEILRYSPVEGKRVLHLFFQLKIVYVKMARYVFSNLKEWLLTFSTIT